MTFFLQQAVNGLALGAVFGLYALGFSLVFANLKAFHVAHAGIFTWAAIFAWYLTEEVGLALWLAMPIASVLAGLVNVATYFVAIRHLEDRRHRDLVVFVSSLGIGIVLTEAALMYLDHKAVRMPFGVVSSKTFTLFDVSISTVQIFMILAAVVVFVALRWVLGSTAFGRQVQAVAADRDMAAMLGVNVNKVNAAVFFISGVLAGIGASLVGAAFNVIDANLGHVYLLMAIAILVIGGIGNVTGGFVGGILVGLASAYTTGYISSSYRDVVVFGFLLLVLIIRPSGLFKSDNILGRA